jgi:hypothetical protein
MTTLVYEQLSDDIIYLKQDVLIEKRIEIKSVRLFMYKSKNPTGSMILKCYRGAVLLGESEVFFDDLHDSKIGKLDPTKYFQGRILFEFPKAIAINSPGTYQFQLHKGPLYSYTFDNHIGWVKMYERRIAPMVDEPQDFTFSPYGIEFYDIKTIG